MGASNFNPETDLQIERLVRSMPESIWRCWAEPELFKQWFTPPGVEVTEVDNDLRPGGRAFNVMKLPDGTLMPNEGCFIDAVPYEKLVFTDAMTAGFRPAASPFMTAICDLIPQDGGTLYRATVLHVDAEGRKRHEEMGFHEGWGTTLDQLAELAAAL